MSVGLIVTEDSDGGMIDCAGTAVGTVEGVETRFTDNVSEVASDVIG
jgi:hypothetical protein